MSGLTQLEALNRVLSARGITKVFSYDSTHPAAVSARDQVEFAIDQVLQKYNWFATDYKVTLSPDGSGEVLLPANVTHVDPTDTHSVYVVRGDKLYDPENSTFNIGASVECIIRFELTWDDYPPSIKQLITWNAVKLALMDRQDEPARLREIDRMILQADAQCMKEKMRAQDVTNMNRPVLQRALAGRALSYTGRYDPNYPGGLSR